MGFKPKIRFNLKNNHIYRSTKKLSQKQLKLLTYLATSTLIAMVAGLLVVIVTIAVVSRDLPSPARLLERSYELSTKLYDRKGTLIYEVFGEKNRTLVPVKDIAPYVVNATLAAEDTDFYQHKGYSVRGMLRAVKNMIFGGSLQSGSTLTQQVIKNTLLTQEQTISRKLKELILSLQLEGRYSKDEILQMYLNETPYGGQNYGIYSAAKAYFNKDPKDLTIAESAYVAGLPQSPSVYSPYSSDPQAGLKRKDYVLYLMNVRGWSGPDGKKLFLSKEDYDKAKAEELKFDTAKVAFKYPHFIFYTKEVLAAMYGENVLEQGGLKVTTSIDSDVQELAEKIVKEEVDKAKSLNVWNGSMVVLDPKTSEILAMVGSKGYNLDSEPEGCVSGGNTDTGCKFDPYVNVATSLRQPGSAIKPITYATMLSQGYTPAFTFLDVPTRFQGSAPDKPYIPENYDGMFRGPMSMRKSLANSLNIPAVKALKIAGINNMIDTSEKMGITSFKDRSRYGLALTLGGGETQLLELTGAFNVFAANGIYKKPTTIVEIKDSKDNVVYKDSTDKGSRALSEEVAFLISDMLSDDGARSDVFGAGSLLNIRGHTVAVKTGTTDDKRDNYAMGFTPSITVGAWVGNSNNDKMNPYVASGITGATPIWNRFMVEYLKNKENEKFEVPKTVVKTEVDSLTGMLPVEDFPRRTEWIVDKTKPTSTGDWYKKFEICKDDGNIVNESCKNYGDTTTQTFIKIMAEVPEWQSSVDDWIKKKYSGESKYFPPTITTNLKYKDGGDVDNKDDVYVKITGINSSKTVYLDFRLIIEVSAFNKIDKVKIYKDGEKVAEDGSRPYGYSFTLSPSDIGKHTFKAVVEDKEGNKGEDSVELNVVGYSVDNNSISVSSTDYKVLQ